MSVVNGFSYLKLIEQSLIRLPMLLLWTRTFDLEFFGEPKPVNIIGVFESSFSRNNARLVAEFTTNFFR